MFGDGSSLEYEWVEETLDDSAFEQPTGQVPFEARQQGVNVDRRKLQ